MKPNQYKKLEEDKAFKRHYMKKTTWWKSFLLLAPTLLLFIGLAGILYMSYNDELWSWYAAPYIAVFALGTIWLKGIKKYIQDKILSKKDAYLVCAARNIGDKSGRYYFIFSKDSKRHNEVLINQLAQELNIESFSTEELNTAKKQAVEIKTSEEETPIYLKGIKVDEVLRANRENISTGIIPLVYATIDHIFVVRNKDLK